MGFRTLSVNGHNRCGPEGSLATGSTRPGRASSTAPRDASGPFCARVRFAGGAVSSSSSRGTPRGSAQRTFAPISAAGCRQSLHLLDHLQTAEAVWGRPWDAAPHPTPRRTEARPRSVNRQPATPASSVDPGPPKRPRHPLRRCAPQLYPGEPGNDRETRRARCDTSAPLSTTPKPPKRPWDQLGVAAPATTPWRTTVRTRDKGTASRYLCLS
jgi:hypothetical protein